MKTTYWVMRYGCCAARDLRFRITCWWLSQQVEFLEWRLRREGLMPSMESNPVSTSVEQRGQYALHSM